MVYIRAHTKRNLFLCLLFFLSLVVVVLLPSSAFSRRWIVVEHPTRTEIGNRSMTVYTWGEVDMGLFKTCHVTPLNDRCKAIDYTSVDPVSISRNCSLDRGIYAARIRSVASFMLISFVAAIPLFLLSGAIFFSHLFHKKEDQICLGPIRVDFPKRLSFFIQLGLSLGVMICMLMCVCIYGDTMSRWIGCGHHYCSHMNEVFYENIISQNTGGAEVVQHMTLNCGFGASFSLAIMTMLSFGVYAALILADKFLFGSNESEEHQKLISTGGEGEEHSVVQLPTSRPNDESGMEMRVAHSRRLENNEPIADPLSEPSQRHIQAEDLVAPVPGASPPRSALLVTSTRLLPEGDDWEWDSDANLFWSPSQELFFDPASGHFYDSDSGSWFNPQTQAWYRLAV